MGTRRENERTSFGIESGHWPVNLTAGEDPHNMIMLLPICRGNVNIEEYWREASLSFLFEHHPHCAWRYYVVETQDRDIGTATENGMEKAFARMCQ